MTKPNFLVIGCGKCGTTSLCSLLAGHPDVYICEPKEPNFLSYNDVYARGWSWYESLFSSGYQAIARGEGSVSYSMEEYEARVIERLSEHFPDIKLIYIARDPIARIESVYREHHTSGHRKGWHMPYTLEEALAYRPAMLTNTKYWERLSAYRKHFPDHQILALLLEDLKTDALSVLKKCFEFLGVDPSVHADTSRSHMNRGSAKLYDTRLLRALRLNPISGILLSIIPNPLRPILERPLRKRFTQPLHWPAHLRSEFLAHIRPDAEQFLRYCNKPDTFWNLSDTV